jgi:hypothetical protein
VWLLMLPSAATLTILMIEIRKRKQNKEI